jgi:O-antigen/teichoic acid export membrane protein
LLIPKFSNDFQIDKREYNNKIKKIFFITLALIILMIMILPYAFKLLFPLYKESIFYGQLLTISILGSIGVINNSFLQSKNKKRKLYKLSIVIPLIKIVLNLFGIIFFGLLGLVVSFIISNVINLLYSTFLVNSKTD